MTPVVSELFYPALTLVGLITTSIAFAFQLLAPTPVPQPLLPESAFTLPVIAAIGGLVVAIIGALAAGIGVVIKAVGDIRKTTAQIEVRVNSEKTAAEGREITLKRENELLREMLSEKKQTAALLAQAASHPRPRATDMPSEPMQVEVVNHESDPVPVAPIKGES